MSSTNNLLSVDRKVFIDLYRDSKNLDDLIEEINVLPQSFSKEQKVFLGNLAVSFHNVKCSELHDKAERVLKNKM